MTMKFDNGSIIEPIISKDTIRGERAKMWFYNDFKLKWHQKFRLWLVIEKYKVKEWIETIFSGK